MYGALRLLQLISSSRACTGLVDWTGGLDRWTGPVDYHFLLSNESSLVGLHLEHFPSQTLAEEFNN